MKGLTTRPARRINIDPEFLAEKATKKSAAQQKKQQARKRKAMRERLATLERDADQKQTKTSTSASDRPKAEKVVLPKTSNIPGKFDADMHSRKQVSAISGTFNIPGQVDTRALVPVRLDNKTIIYVKPGKNVNEVLKRYQTQAINEIIQLNKPNIL